MLSFVRRWNPFLRVSAPAPPTLVTRCVQADLDNVSEDSHTVIINTSHVANTRRGINRLLREFEKNDYTVATLMDQNGCVFFTIDLTEMINHDAELKKIVKVVQRSIENLPSLTLNHPDELATKLKRHFLYDSIKKLDQTQRKKNSSDYYTVAEKNTESLRKCGERNRKLLEDRMDIDHTNSSSEREIQSLLYELSSSLTPEENMELLESLRSSLATKIYKQIEETIKNIKRKHYLNNGTGDRESIYATFSYHSEPYQNANQDIEHDCDNYGVRKRPKKPQTRRRMPFRDLSSSSRSMVMRKKSFRCGQKETHSSRFSAESPGTKIPDNRKPVGADQHFTATYTSPSTPRTKKREPKIDVFRSVISNDQSEAMKSSNPMPQRPATAPKTRFLQARQNIMEKVRRKATPNKYTKNISVHVCKSREMKPRGEHVEGHEKDNHNRSKTTNRQPQLKPKSPEKILNKRLQESKKRKCPATKRKHQRPQLQNLHRAADVTKVTDEKQLVLYKNQEATCKNKSKERKRVHKKNEPKVLANNLEPSSSDCRCYRPKTGKRGASKKRDAREVARMEKYSERFVASVSHGHA